MTSPLSQSQYQVRFDWGVDGAIAIGADADILIVVDVLDSGDGADVVAATTDLPATVLQGSLRNRFAAAKYALSRQGDKGERFMVAIVAAGERREDGALRFALEDLLGAGAIIDGLADVGIDYCSPEAAAAAAAFTGLRNATGHLIGAAGSGRIRAAAGDRAAIERAIELDAEHDVRVLREFSAQA
jgi:2-phosphosulfolactate phosphatase